MFGKHKPPTHRVELWNNCTSDTHHSMLSVGSHLLPVKCKTNGGFDLVRSKGRERRKAEIFSRDP